MDAVWQDGNETRMHSTGAAAGWKVANGVVETVALTLLRFGMSPETVALALLRFGRLPMAWSKPSHGHCSGLE